MAGTVFPLEVRPRLPEALAYLETFANDLLYSWNRRLRGLYYRLDPELWEACMHNPKLFLRRVAQEKLDPAVRDAAFMVDYEEIIKVYETYLHRGLDPILPKEMESHDTLIAYFCAEYGFYESFPIYSGGLGHIWPATTASPPAISDCRLWRSGCFTDKGISTRPSTSTATRLLPIPGRTSMTCRSGRVTDAGGADLQYRCRTAGAHRARPGVAGQGRAHPAVSAGYRSAGEQRIRTG